MKPNIQMINQLISNKFNGNKSAFAKEIGVERSHLSHILNSGNCAGANFFGALMEYCEKNKLKFREYIFLPNDVKIINTTNSKNTA